MALRCCLGQEVHHLHEMSQSVTSHASDVLTVPDSCVDSIHTSQTQWNQGQYKYNIYISHEWNHSRSGSWQGIAASTKEAKYRQLDNSKIFCSSCCWDSGDVKPPSCGTNTGAGPKNISRQSKHKRNKFPVSAAVRGFTTEKTAVSFHGTFTIE